jgi:hypothetical protein
MKLQKTAKNTLNLAKGLEQIQGFNHGRRTGCPKFEFLHILKTFKET